MSECAYSPFYEPTTQSVKWLGQWLGHGHYATAMVEYLIPIALVAVATPPSIGSVWLGQWRGHSD